MNELANAAPMLVVLLVTVVGWLYGRHLHRKLLRDEAARRSRPAE